MSKIFEALARDQNSIPDFSLEPLLEGQAGGETQAPAACPPPNPRVKVDPGTADRKAPAEPVSTGAVVRVVQFRVTPSSPILPFDGTHLQAGEQYRMLRTKIVQYPRPLQMVVVTSACPSDGKSVTVINLAGVLALKSDARVLLVDCDFRRSTVPRQLGLADGPGLAQVLRGECTLNEAVVQAQQIPNLFVLPAGRTSANPAELLDSSAWTSLCAAWRSEFKYVVVDSPPIDAVADYDLIQAVCDGVILVLRPDRTDRSLCLKALQTIPKDKLLGVVLNCVESFFLDKNSKYSGYYQYYQKATPAT